MTDMSTLQDDKLANQYFPDYCVAPGDTLSEIMNFSGVTIGELSLRTGLSAANLDDIIDGTGVITHSDALALERGVGVSASFWENSESAYRGFLHKRV